MISKAFLKNLPSDVQAFLRSTRDMLILPLWQLKTRSYVFKLLKTKGLINLEIGAGKKKGDNNWTTLDLNFICDICWDLNWPLPFPDNSVDKIYSSHVLEHFNYTELIKLLNKCYRVLRRGGTFSVCVPNASIYLTAYFQPNEFQPDKYCTCKPFYNFNSKIDYVNYIAYMDGTHRYMFDKDNLLIILNNIGFKNVRIRSFDPSIDLEERRYESIYAVGEK